MRQRVLKRANDSVEFMTKAKFSKLIENTVRLSGLSHMEAIIDLCEKYGIEPEDCKKYVSNPIREKLEAEAQELNFFGRGRVNKLPV